MAIMLQDQRMSDGPYSIEHGDVWHSAGNPRLAGAAAMGLSDPGRRHVCDGSQWLAVAYDGEDGTLHKHGEASKVEAWADATRRRFSEAGFEDLAAGIMTLSFPVSEETVAELNACVSSTGRVLKLPERFAALGEANPGIARPRLPA